MEYPKTKIHINSVQVAPSSSEPCMQAIIQFLEKEYINIRVYGMDMGLGNNKDYKRHTIKTVIDNLNKYLSLLDKEQ